MFRYPKTYMPDQMTEKVGSPRNMMYSEVMKGRSVAGDGTGHGDKFFGAISHMMKKEGLNYNSEVKRDNKMKVGQFLSQQLGDGSSDRPARVRVARALQNRKTLRN